MADNIVFQSSTLATPPDGTPVAADDVGGIYYERVKLDGGGNGLSVPFVAGQQVAAASLPVVIASDQSSIPVTATLTSTTITGNVTVVQPTAASLNATVVGTGTLAVQAAQSGTWTVQPGNTANTTAWKVDGSAVTQPVSAASLPLPSGASTSAKQPALGTAGTASADVITVQGIASMTALKVDGSAVTQPVSGTVTATGPLTDTQLRATPVPVTATLTSTTITGNVTVVQPTGTSLHAVLDTTSTTAVTQGTATNLKAEVIGAGTAGTANAGVVTVQGIASMTPVQVSQATASTLNATVVGSGSAGTAATGVVTVQGIASMTPLLVTPAANSAVNVAQLAGTTTSVSSGNKDNGTLRVVIATDQPKLSVTSNYPIRQFLGTAQTVISTATDIAAGNFSTAPTTYDNTNDAAVPYARYASAVLQAPDWAAAPVAGTTIDLYGVLQNVDSTSDETDAPSGTSAGGAHYFGSWYVAAADALQRRAITIDLLGVTAVDFYIKNSTAQNMNNDAGTSCIVKVTPVALGVVA